MVGVCVWQREGGEGEGENPFPSTLKKVFGAVWHLGFTSYSSRFCEPVLEAATAWSWLIISKWD